LLVNEPEVMPSAVAAIAATTVLVCPPAVLKAIRVAPSPLKEIVPAFAVEIRGAQVAPPLLERRNPSPK
jgi:hypothetical protein